MRICPVEDSFCNHCREAVIRSPSSLVASNLNSGPASTTNVVPSLLLNRSGHHLRSERNCNHRPVDGDKVPFQSFRQDNARRRCPSGRKAGHGSTVVTVPLTGLIIDPDHFRSFPVRHQAKGMNRALTPELREYDAIAVNRTDNDLTVVGTFAFSICPQFSLSLGIESCQPVLTWDKNITLSVMLDNERCRMGRSDWTILLSMQIRPSSSSVQSDNKGRYGDPMERELCYQDHWADRIAPCHFGVTKLWMNRFTHFSWPSCEYRAMSELPKATYKASCVNAEC